MKFTIPIEAWFKITERVTHSDGKTETKTCLVKRNLKEVEDEWWDSLSWIEKIRYRKQRFYKRRTRGR